MPGDLLAVLARPCLPLSHRTFIETERRHDGLERTPVAKQSQHHSPHVCCRAQPVKGRPRRGRKGPPTGTTAVPLLLPTMDTDITQPTLSPVGTVWGVTELIVWVPLVASSIAFQKNNYMVTVSKPFTQGWPEPVISSSRE